MSVRILVGHALDVLRIMPAKSVQTCVTSPPYYGLRDYGIPGQLGLEPTPAEYIANLVAVFRQVREVLRDDGTLWLNLGDSYNSIGHKKSNNGYGSTGLAGGKPQIHYPCHRENTMPGLKHKDQIGIPWRVAFALQDDGWYLRSDIIWSKPNSMPESVTDRPTKSHEYIFLLAKSERYFYDAEAIKEPSVTDDIRRPYTSKGAWDLDGRPEEQRHGGEPRNSNGAGSIRNCRSVWTIATQPFSEWIEISRWHRVTSDAASDGMRRIEFLGCPVHDCLDRPCDEREADMLTRTEHTDAGPGQAPSCERVPNSTHPDASRSGCSLDSPGPLCSPSAIDRNNGNYRTGLAPVTNPSCTPCAGTGDRIGDTQELSLSVGQHGYTPDNSTLPDVMDDHQMARMTYRTVHKSSLPIPPECMCSFYHKVTEKSSHFATFPPELPERCIKAGTSEKGACPTCGKPWRRIVQKPDMADRPRRSASAKYQQSEWIGVTSAGQQYQEWLNENPDVTIGWEPSCTCGAPSDLKPDDLEWILTPTGERNGDDPSLLTGRAGYNRPRGPDEGQRPITRYAQRRYAVQLRNSPHRDAMAAEAGSAFDHYIRTDRTGARPVPDDLLDAWIERGWLERVALPAWQPPDPVPQTVLDPFGGACTTGLVASRLGRNAVIIELNPTYAEMGRLRIVNDAPMLADVEAEPHETAVQPALI